jgi:GT2 family glycosyltransferase
MSKSGEWPRISIVTPSLNQGAFIEQAIRSVMLQGYPNLEYVIVDGCSSDSTLTHVRRYADRITAWVSEPDQGQSDAIRKGFAAATGEILAWLNADDFYLTDSFFCVAEAWRSKPGSILAGDVWHLDEPTGGRKLVRAFGLSAGNLVRYWEGHASLQQPGVFFPRAAYDAVGGVDVDLRHAMDYDLLCRLALTDTPVEYVGRPLATFRIHSRSKTASEVVAMILETSQVSRRYWDRVGGVTEQAERRFVARALMGHARRSLVEGHILEAARAGLRSASTDVRAVGDALAWALRSSRRRAT